jgi:hypothetical protein
MLAPAVRTNTCRGWHTWNPSFGNRNPVAGCSTAGRAVMATKRSLFDNRNPGIAPPPCAWSIEMGQCSAARTPPRAVRPSRWRDQEAARSNRRATPVSVRVTSQWCAQEAADQAARTPWLPGRQHGRGPSWRCAPCCLRPLARPGCDDHHSSPISLLSYLILSYYCATCTSQLRIIITPATDQEYELL